MNNFFKLRTVHPAPVIAVLAKKIYEAPEREQTHATIPIESPSPSVAVLPLLEYVMHFDGCSKGNPGEAGAGAVIYQYGKEIWASSEYVGRKETNNFAEYKGLILGLKGALELNIDNLFVCGDSMLVINQMNGKYKVNSPNLAQVYGESKKLASQFNSVSFNHVYRNKNKRADELSNKALDDDDNAC
jgi:ribonuclease HI